MPEVELERHESLKNDSFGQRIGIVAAAIGAILAIATIASHRSHTNSVVLRSEANDQWSLYQAKRIKSHTAQLGSDLLSVLKPGARSDARKRYADEVATNDRESKDVQREARHLEALSEKSERQALSYDLGEGLLEIGLVLCSLYFVSRRRLFPLLGITAGLAGALVAASGPLLH